VDFLMEGEERQEAGEEDGHGERQKQDGVEGPAQDFAVGGGGQGDERAGESGAGACVLGTAHRIHHYTRVVRRSVL
jgi:hypothetical protein